MSSSTCFKTMEEALKDPLGRDQRPGGERGCDPQTIPLVEGRPRVIEAHADFLAVSWSGDLDYWRGIEVDRESRRLEKLPRSRTIAKTRLRAQSVKAVLERYAHKQDGPYAVERMVFYKASERVPKSLETHAAECIASFHDVPLHRYLILERCQPVADEHAELIFTRWRVQKDKHSDLCAVVTALHAEINAEPVPDKGMTGEPGDWPVGTLLLLAGFAGLLAGAALILFALPLDLVTGLLERLR
ncbi:hypothetical protein [Maricaulis sp.]|uniref:hypothetical protein n=1 Tax=Maricaulis sp. TaxID=1486257 RepID=UPI003A935B8F